MAPSAGANSIHNNGFEIEMNLRHAGRQHIGSDLFFAKHPDPPEVLVNQDVGNLVEGTKAKRRRSSWW